MGRDLTRRTRIYNLTHIVATVRMLAGDRQRSSRLTQSFDSVTFVSKNPRAPRITTVYYLEEPPNLHLRPWVRSLWYCRAPGISHSYERVLPNGCMQVIFNLSRSYLTGCSADGKTTFRLPRSIVVGARTHFAFVATSDMEELIGVVIRPGGFAGLFRERADLFFERSIGLEEVWSGSRITERISEARSPKDKIGALEDFLTDRVLQDSRRSVLVDQAIQLFQAGGLRVSECAQIIGVSQRRLSEVFQEHVGMSPKTWCRVQRFQGAVRALHNRVDVPWAELALCCEYYDQSHFANDFQAFSGINPTTYSARRETWQNHVPVT